MREIAHPYRACARPLHECAWPARCHFPIVQGGKATLCGQPRAKHREGDKEEDDHDYTATCPCPACRRAFANMEP